MGELSQQQMGEISRLLGAYGNTNNNPDVSFAHAQPPQGNQVQEVLNYLRETQQNRCANIYW